MAVAHSLQTLPEPLLQKIVHVVHGERELTGCMVGYSHQGASRIIHKGFSPAFNWRDKLVIVELSSLAPGAVAHAAPAPPATNISKIYPELVGLGCNLLAFTFSLTGTVGGTASAPVTGPFGAAVAVCCWAGLVTSGIQFGNALVRFWAIAVDPYGSSLERWDGNVTYDAFITGLDAGGIVAGVGGMAMAGPALSRLLQARSGLSMARLQQLSTMDKATREQILRTAYQHIMATPAGKAELEAALKKLKISAAGMGKARHSQKVLEAISPVAQHRIGEAVKDLLKGATGPLFSALPGAYVGSASGSVNRFAPPMMAVAVHVLLREWPERVAHHDLAREKVMP